jgi:hypothetical protein
MGVPTHSLGAGKISPAGESGSLFQGKRKDFVKTLMEPSGPPHFGTPHRLPTA